MSREENQPKDFVTVQEIACEVEPPPMEKFGVPLAVQDHEEELPLPPMEMFGELMHYVWRHQPKITYPNGRT